MSDTRYRRDGYDPELHRLTSEHIKLMCSVAYGVPDADAIQASRDALRRTRLRLAAQSGRMTPAREGGPESPE